MKTVKDFLQGSECLIIAEVAQAHDGSLGMAHSFIDAAAKTGVNAIKFQTHIAEAESTPLEPWRVKFSKQDATRFDYWKRMEFTEPQWAGLKQHAEEKGLIFLSSPFSNEAVGLLERLDIQAWKIASGELTNYPMLEQIYKTKKPLLVSSGMSQLEELDALINQVKEKDLLFAVLQCTSAYPTPPEKVGLNVMQEFRERYHCPVGLSDHSGTIYPGLAGAALGMNILEVHLALSKDMFGPDVIASVDKSELKSLVDGIRFIEKMRQNPVVKNEISQDLQPLRNLFTKSIVASRDLVDGTVISMDDLAFKKPGTGIPASGYKTLIGRKINKEVSYNHFFSEEDFLD
jgi:N,N'-diacetyllegionaminate synthase